MRLARLFFLAVCGIFVFNSSAAFARRLNGSYSSAGSKTPSRSSGRSKSRQRLPISPGLPDAGKASSPLPAPASK